MHFTGWYIFALNPNECYDTLEVVSLPQTLPCYNSRNPGERICNHGDLDSGFLFDPCLSTRSYQ